MSFRTALLKNVIFPLTDLVRGRHLSSTMRFLHKSQWWSAAELEQLQLKELNKLLAYAVVHVPHYRSLRESGAIKTEKLDTLSELKNIPLLTKPVLQAHPTEHFLADVPDQKGWGRSRTGGSTTGEPMHFFYDPNTKNWGRAAFYRAFDWAGCPPGTASLEVWGQPVAQMGWRFNLNVKMMELLFNWTSVNAFRLNEAVFKKCIDTINNKKIEFIYGYTSAIAELCRYIQKNNIKVRPVRSIMTTAEVLLPETRRLLADTLHAQVFDGYACSEINGIAYESEEHNGFHIAMERAIVEVVDDAGNPLPDGTHGNLAITDLHNKAMPLIRYVNGDQGIITRSNETGKRQLMRLTDILGRTCDIIDGVNGNKLHSFYFSSMFASLGWAESLGLTKYQVIQENATDLYIYLAVQKEIPEAEKQKLIDVLTGYLGNMHFILKINEPFVLSKSGKLRWTMNKLRV